MRNRTLQRTLQLQAEDGSFVEVAEWVRTPQSPMPGRVAVLPSNAEYMASPGGRVNKINDVEYIIVATGARLTDTTERE